MIKNIVIDNYYEARFSADIEGACNLINTDDMDARHTFPAGISATLTQQRKNVSQPKNFRSAQHCCILESESPANRPRNKTDDL